MRNGLMLFFMLCMAGILEVSGQQSAIYTNNWSEFDNAVLLFKDQQYQSAQILFDKVKQNNPSQDIQADCAYYIGICAIHLLQLSKSPSKSRQPHPFQCQALTLPFRC